MPYTKERFTVEKVLKVKRNKAFVRWLNHAKPDWQPLYEIRKTKAFADYKAERITRRAEMRKTSLLKILKRPNVSVFYRPGVPGKPHKLLKLPMVPGLPIEHTFPDQKKSAFKNNSNGILKAMASNLGATTALVIDHPASMRTTTALAPIMTKIVIPNPALKSGLCRSGHLSIETFCGTLREYLATGKTLFGCTFLDFQGFLDTNKKDLKATLGILDFGRFNQGAAFGATFCKTRGGASPIESRGTLEAIFEGHGLNHELVAELEDTSVVTHFFILRKKMTLK